MQFVKDYWADEAVDKTDDSAPNYTGQIQSLKAGESRFERQEVEAYNLRIGHGKSPEQTEGIKDNDESAYTNGMFH